MVDMLMLFVKGVVGTLALGVLLIALLALHHLQSYVARNYPRIDAFGRSAVVVLISSICVVGGMLLLGIVVETFFWR